MSKTKDAAPQDTEANRLGMQKGTNPSDWSAAAAVAVEEAAAEPDTPKRSTLYRIQRLRKISEGPNEGDLWVVVGQQEALNATAALRAYVRDAYGDDGDVEGEVFEAIPYSKITRWEPRVIVQKRLV